MKRCMYDILCVVFFVTDCFGATFSMPKSVRQGDYFVVQIDATTPALDYRVQFHEKWYSTYVLKLYDAVDKKEIRYAFIPVDVSQKSGSADVAVSGFSKKSKPEKQDSEIEVIVPRSIMIEAGTFPQMPVRDEAPLAKEDLERNKREEKELASMYLRESNERYFSFTDDMKPLIDVPFLLPFIYVPNYSSVFGTIRPVRVGGKEPVVTRHWGVDYPVPVGTPVLPVAPGVVVFAGELLLSGKTIVIDHGEGLMSAYFHLSDIVVRQGNMANRANGPIGYSGNTGRRSRGAHLHLAIKLHGVWVNPVAFLPKGDS